MQALQVYCRKLADRWREAGPQIEHWYNIVKLQFPIYVNYWKKHPDVKSRKPICQEEPFAINYELPSGRIVVLRGKFDAIDSIDKALYLQENKAKGDPSEQQILRQLTFDLQTMIYAIAARREYHTAKFGGVRYNVIRRPLSGGKHSITQHKGRKTLKGLVGVESTEQFYVRLAKLINENASHFFNRYRVEIGQHDLDKFEHTCLIPILENLCDDYEWWAYCQRNTLSSFDGGRKIQFPRQSPRHFRLPYGVYNSLAEGGSTAYDEYLATGSEIGLERTTNLFPELTEGP